jgi:bilirubin oxidase
LDRNGVTPTDGERGRKDVVLIPPGDSVTFITQFTDFADSLMPYMYHCHILMHEDDGMMGQFVVMPTSVGVNEISSQNTNVKAYPNPAKDNISIAIPTSIQNYQLSVKNIVGQTIYSVNANQEKQEINTSSWPRGMYFVEVLNNDFRQSEKIVLQ